MCSMQIEGRRGKPAPALTKPQKRQEAVASEMPYPEETVHLEETLDKIECDLQEAADTVDRHDREYMESKRYMADYRGEIDPKEIFQNELLLKDIERSGIHAVKVRDKLIKMMDSPYFARIDFRCGEAGEADTPETYYIGRFHYSRDGEMLIYDWRAPVSGMFYDCELGMAGFDAPMGRIDGEITRRRQFKISGGRLEYALESSIRIGDEILQRELGSTSSEKMRSIISTLQREQNLVIRNEKDDILIIQGVAGSGKTSIALHRIAYLLYRHKETLTAKNVVILSPNRVFGDYISNVLPELGEEPIYEVSFADLAEVQLGRTMAFEKDKDLVECRDQAWAMRVKAKSSLEFLERMKEYLGETIPNLFQAADFKCQNISVPKQWIEKRYLAYGDMPVRRRLREMASDILGQLESENFMGLELPKESAVLKDLKRMLRLKNTMDLYKDFYKTTGMPELLVMPKRKTLEWADVYPYLYFLYHFEGLKESPLIRHLVVDEMQDYTPVQYAVLNLMFRCRMTILGDFGQTVNPYTACTLKDLRAVFPKAETAVLNKSYRSTYEIITFAGRIQRDIDIVPVERHGKKPEIIGCRDFDQEAAEIEEVLKSFLRSEYATLGIITKSESGAKELFDRLSPRYPVQLITSGSKSFPSGVSIVTVQMAKGLEFDEVIVFSANVETYANDFDRNLLYIACTRAMHRLTLTYCGEITPLAKDC